MKNPIKQILEIAADALENLAHSLRKIVKSSSKQYKTNKPIKFTLNDEKLISVEQEELDKLLIQIDEKDKLLSLKLTELIENISKDPGFAEIFTQWRTKIKFQFDETTKKIDKSIDKKIYGEDVYNHEIDLCRININYAESIKIRATEKIENAIHTISNLNEEGQVLGEDLKKVLGDSIFVYKKLVQDTTDESEISILKERIRMGEKSIEWVNSAYSFISNQADQQEKEFRQRLNNITTVFDNFIKEEKEKLNRLENSSN